MGFTITYTAVVWTAGDIITEAKLDNMVANDQAYDAHGAQGLQLDEMSAPSTPSSGKVRLYAKTDGKLYIKDDVGTETDLTASGTSFTPIGAKVYLSADVTLGNASWTKITFDTEEYDIAGNFASNKFTVPTGKAGYYHIYVCGYYYNAITIGNQYKIAIYKNGSLVTDSELVGAGTNVGESCQNGTILHLNATDYIEFYGYSPNANTKVYNGGGAATHSWAFIQQLSND